MSDRQEIESITLTGMQENLHILYRYQSRLLYNIPYHRPRLRRRRLPFPEHKPQDSSDAGRPKGTELPTIPWKEDILDVPLFRAPVQTSRGCATSADTALSYEKYHEWIKRLGEETGFVQVFTTYCLRRATGNAINGEP